MATAIRDTQHTPSRTICLDHFVIDRRRPYYVSGRDPGLAIIAEDRWTIPCKRSHGDDILTIRRQPRNREWTIEDWESTRRRTVSNRDNFDSGDPLMRSYNRLRHSVHRP